MVFKFLQSLRNEVGQENFKIILAATTADIMFNNVSFGKKTSPKEFIARCLGCKRAVIGNE